MIRAVIFDLYGVLVLNGWQDFKQKHFGNRPEEWARLRELGQAVDAKKASYGELVKAIAKASDTNEKDVKQSLESNEVNTQLLVFIASEMPAIKKAILSNASRNVLPEIFSVGELSLFDASILSAETGLTKPDRQIYALACEKLDVDPSECIFIDDKSENTDVATAMGMRAIVYQSPEQTIKAIGRELTK